MKIHLLLARPAQDATDNSETMLLYGMTEGEHQHDPEVLNTALGSAQGDTKRISAAGLLEIEVDDALIEQALRAPTVQG